MHIAKKGLRVLGIAESFSSDDRSILAGVVMRKDLRIDGFSFETTTVGGMDATDSIVALYRSFFRKDINAIMVSGCVISWFNIIDPVRILEETSRPVVIVTYEDSNGIEKDIAYHFPHDELRLACYQALGNRVPHLLPTGYTIYLRAYGISEDDAGTLCSAFTYDGKIPEPIRLARLFARAVMLSRRHHKKLTDSRNEK